jgi:glycosyltransferase involved in cell wall biosynthesis
MSIQLSIAIVTRNRPESLTKTLNSIINQTVKPFEVIISDDSDDDIATEVKNLVSEYGFKYFRGPQKGLYANRNFVAKQCQGTHFRTMDDDHTFTNDHFEKCFECLKTDTSSIWILGEYFPDKIDYNMINPPIPGQLNINGVSSAPINNQNSWAISCGGTIYPLSIIKQGIYYCELYSFGNLHLEYGARLYKLNYRIRLISNTFIIHNIYENKRSYCLGKKEIEINFFLSLCYGLLYFPSLFNKFQLVIIFIKLIFKNKFKIFFTCLDSFKVFQNFKKTYFKS